MTRSVTIAIPSLRSLQHPSATKSRTPVYVGFCIGWVLSRSSSIYRIFTKRTIERLTLDAIDAKRNNRYSVTSFLTTPLAHQLMYYLYIRVAVQGAFPCHSSQYCAQSCMFNLRIAAKPRSCQLTYVLYVGFCFKPCLSCYASQYCRFIIN